MLRWFVLVYGVVAYLIFLGSFLCAVGFAGGFAVPKTIDSGATATLYEVVLIDLGLLSLFALQHRAAAVMEDKRWSGKIEESKVHGGQVVRLEAKRANPGR